MFPRGIEGGEEEEEEGKGGTENGMCVFYLCMYLRAFISTFVLTMI